MQIVPQEIGTVCSSMPIKDPKISRFFPIVTVIGFRYVQNDSNSIFIVVANRPLICRCRICSNNSIGLQGVLGRLKVGNRQHNFGKWRLSVFLNSYAPIFKLKFFRVNEYFFSDNLILLLLRRFWFRPGLVFIRRVFYQWIFDRLNFFIGVVILFFLHILFTMKILSAFVSVFSSTGLGNFNLCMKIWF